MAAELWGPLEVCLLRDLRCPSHLGPDLHGAGRAPGIGVSAGTQKEGQLGALREEGRGGPEGHLERGVSEGGDRASSGSRLDSCSGFLSHVHTCDSISCL